MAVCSMLHLLHSSSCLLLYKLFQPCKSSTEVKLSTPELIMSSLLFFGMLVSPER